MDGDSCYWLVCVVKRRWCGTCFEFVIDIVVLFVVVVHVGQTCQFVRAVCCVFCVLLCKVLLNRSPVCQSHL